ncbi:hypothetical protein PCL_11523 [Purpureocillium lilacinum]|uniref:Uncharacterized protein n=1 Tax=Purpureocillium lilacinum TaxID=33203 RepID=A0A2U3EA95_PURLI|nr:hypothetical protein Purlil1_2778 [Purpureocillium lilacinum]PWI71429.1 hypothetical protein PCL_11523 [Purpureocillium lilacinum]
MGKAEVLTRGEARHGRYGMGKAWHGMAWQGSAHGMAWDWRAWDGATRRRRRRRPRGADMEWTEPADGLLPGVDAARSAHGMVPYGAVRFGMTREEGQARRKDESQARKQGSTSKQGSKGTRGQGRA